MKKIAALIALVCLTACGADGPPITPSAKVGVSVTPSGISVKPRIGAGAGPLSVGLSL